VYSDPLVSFRGESGSESGSEVGDGSDETTRDS